MNLSNLPVTQQTTAVIAILREGGGLAANEAVQDIADAGGDKAAAVVIAQLPALVIADIVRNFDYTKPGIVGALLTPVQLREAVERLPLVDNMNRSTDSVSAMEELICGVILLKDESARGKFFRELGTSAVGLTALASVFPQDEFVCFVRHKKFVDDDDADTVSEATVQQGNWQELALALRSNSPKTYHQVSELVIAAKRDQVDLEAEVTALARTKFGNELVTADDPYAL